MDNQKSYIIYIHLGTCCFVFWTEKSTCQFRSKFIDCCDLLNPLCYFWWIFLVFHQFRPIDHLMFATFEIGNGRLHLQYGLIQIALLASVPKAIFMSCITNRQFKQIISIDAPILNVSVFGHRTQHHVNFATNIALCIFDVSFCSLTEIFTKFLSDLSQARLRNFIFILRFQFCIEVCEQLIPWCIENSSSFSFVCTLDSISVANSVSQFGAISQKCMKLVRQNLIIDNGWCSLWFGKISFQDSSCSSLNHSSFYKLWPLILDGLTFQIFWPMLGNFTDCDVAQLLSKKYQVMRNFMIKWFEQGCDILPKWRRKINWFNNMNFLCFTASFLK